MALIRFVDLVALVALAGPATLFALLLPPVAAEINAANINFPMGLAIVAAFRWPALWAFPLLTKVTPGVGVLWFAVRREWRALRDRGRRHGRPRGGVVPGEPVAVGRVRGVPGQRHAARRRLAVPLPPAGCDCPWRSCS